MPDHLRQNPTIRGADGVLLRPPLKTAMTSGGVLA